MGKRILGCFFGLIAFFLVTGIAMTPLEEETLAEQAAQEIVQAADQVVIESELLMVPTDLSAAISTPSPSEPVQNSEPDFTANSEEFERSEKKTEAALMITRVDYILNTNSKKFHYPNCPSVDLMNESNKKPYEGTREGAIELGYEPCLNCNP